jgi:hypothetical protein
MAFVSRGYVGFDIETVAQDAYRDPARYVWHGGEWELLEGWRPNGVGVDWRDADVAVLDEAVVKGCAPLAATGVVPALHPTTCRVVQVSFGYRGRDGEVVRRVLQVDQYESSWGCTSVEAEGRVVEEGLGILAEFHRRGWTLVGFNTKSFDLPVLRWRSRLLRLGNVPELPWWRLTYRYESEVHCDLRLEFSGGDSWARGTLQHWATAFGVHAEERGGEVQDMVDRRDWESLMSYGLAESRTLVELYEAAVLGVRVPSVVEG